MATLPLVRRILQLLPLHLRGCHAIPPRLDLKTPGLRMSGDVARYKIKPCHRGGR